MLQELKETGKVDWVGGEFLGLPRRGSQGLMDELIRDADYLRVAEIWAAAKQG
jgi:hypothetical protein